MAGTDINNTVGQQTPPPTLAPQPSDQTAPTPAGGSSSSPPPTLAPQAAGVGTTAAAAPASSAGASPVSSDGSIDWGSILGDLGSFLGNNAGALSMLGLGEYEASQAESQTAALTGQLTGPAQPFVNAGGTELAQTLQGLTGAPVSGGSIGQQEQAAQELGQVATTYSTGQLTTAQQQQVQQQTAAQKQQIRAQLAQQGITDSSVIAMYDQQIDNNAAQLTQQLTNQNLQMGETALGAVQSTYSNLLNQSISTFGAGMGPIEDAVQTTIQQNTAIANGLQSLFGNIAKAMSSGSGGSSSSSSLGNLLGNLGGALGKALGLSSSSAVAGGVPSAASAAASDSLVNSTGIGDISSWGADGSAANSTWGGVAADANAGGPGASSTPGSGAPSTPAWGGIAADATGAGLGADAGIAGSVSITTDPAALAADGYSSIGGTGAAAAAGGGGAGDAAAAAGGGANSLGLAAGALGAAAGVYDLATNWQSGAAGTDALGGAETGAGVGTMILPGIGTAVGALIGGAAGALSSVFGGGTVDPETRDVQNVINAVGNGNNNPAVAATAQNPYLMMAGLFDRQQSTLPIYQKYGRMGEQAFTNDMVKQINSAMASGQITSSTSSEDVYNKVVAPWLQSMGDWSNVGATYTATVQGLSYDMVNQYMTGTAANDWKAVGGDSPFSDIYNGSSITAAPTPAAIAAGGTSGGSRMRTQQF